MTFEAVKEILIHKFGSEVIVAEETSGLQSALVIQPDSIVDVCLELRNNDKTYFDFLSCLSGVDYGNEENKFGVVYHLASIPYKTQLVLKVVKIHIGSAAANMPFFKSVSTVWRTAEWHEREAFDLLGLYFEGNPDLRRILLPDDWEGYPLRKNYQTPAFYKGIKVDY
jgi:NADH-quinone oxidoreductase subunit C